jgi:hypothetical protein
MTTLFGGSQAEKALRYVGLGHQIVLLAKRRHDSGSYDKVIHTACKVERGV